MKAVLTVRNFGPIKNAELDLRDVNVLIGPQASGKSTLAKIYTICKSPIMFHSSLGKNNIREDGKIELRKYQPSIKQFENSLKHFSINSFFTSDSFIKYTSEIHEVIIENGEIVFNDKLQLDDLNSLIKERKYDEVENRLKQLCLKSINFNFDYGWTIFECREFKNEKSIFFSDSLTETYRTIYKDSYKKNMNLTENELVTLVESAIRFKNEYFINKAIYIPAERTIVGLLKQASLNFRNSGIPIPPHLMDYAAQYESATFQVKKLNLSFLSAGKKVQYKNINGQDLIFFDKNKSIPLTESASGFQSLIPMLLPIHRLRNNDIDSIEVNYSFVIEELESNLFPLAQYEVIKFLEGGRIDDEMKVDKGSNHMYTTHSPFVLSSLNNMLYAFKLGNNSKSSLKISKIIPEECWINPTKFSAYEIRNGKAISIFNRRIGLIKENAIDKVSEDIFSDFRKIALASVND